MFTKMEDFMESLKESISKFKSSPKSSLSQESLSHMFSALESNFKAELAPLKLVNLMPTDAPPVKTWVQGGEKGVGSSFSKGVGSRS